MMLRRVENYKQNKSVLRRSAKKKLQCVHIPRRIGIKQEVSEAKSSYNKTDMGINQKLCLPSYLGHLEIPHLIEVVV